MCASPFVTEAGLPFGEIRSPVSENGNPASVAPMFSNRDETRLPECSGKPGGEERCAVRSRGGFGASQSFGLRVCPLAESLARGRVQIQRDGTGTQAERRPD